VLGITDLGTYVLGTIVIVLVPGPNTLFVLTTAAKRGVGAGYRAAAGVFTGDGVLMLLSSLGVASLMRAYPPLFIVIKYLGAGYLAWIGFGMIRGAVRRWRARPADTAPAAPEAVAAPDRTFHRSLMVSLLNPKAILFFMAFFVQFVDPAYAYPALSFLVLGAILTLVSATQLSILIFTGSFLAAQFRRRRRLTAGMTSAVGALFIGFSLRLATASAG
jgi:leucine efflux protein